MGALSSTISQHAEVKSGVQREADGMRLSGGPRRRWTSRRTSDAANNAGLGSKQPIQLGPRS